MMNSMFSSTKKRFKKRLKLVIFVCGFLFIFLVLFLVFKICFDFFGISTNSMSPTLEKGDIVFIKKMEGIKRGDLIAFTITKTMKDFNIPKAFGGNKVTVVDRKSSITLCLGSTCENLPKTTKNIGRVIGLPGDTIRLVSGNIVLCNNNDCKQLDESAYLLGDNTEATCGKSEFYISSGYFVLSDNRTALLDSRCCFSVKGCELGNSYEIYKKNIIGIASKR